jgi:excisionase family DNA binding protein
MFPVKDAAKRLGISRNKLYQKVERREISHYRIDGKILFSEEQLQEFLDGCLVGKATNSRKIPTPPVRVPVKPLRNLSLE